MVKKAEFLFEKSYSVAYGHLKKPHATDAIEINLGTGADIFIKIDKSQEWLLKAMCPDKTRNKKNHLKLSLIHI